MALLRAVPSTRTPSVTSRPAPTHVPPVHWAMRAEVGRNTSAILASGLMDSKVYSDYDSFLEIQTLIVNEWGDV